MSPVRFWSCLAVVLSLATLAPAKEKYPVTISYTLQPDRPLPPNIRSLAVLDAGVEITDGGNEADRSQRWSVITAQMMEAMLQDASQSGPAGPKVARRDATGRNLADKGLHLQGIVEGPPAQQAGKLLSVDGLIMSRIAVHIDTHHQEKDVVDWRGILVNVDVAHNHDVHFHSYDGYPYYDHGTHVGVHVGIPTRTISEIRSSLTVQCSFALVDAATGRILAQSEPQPYHTTDAAEPNFIFSRYIDQADLDPVDHFIGELVEHAAGDFVSMLVPTRVVVNYTVIGKSKHGEAAVYALRANDFRAAMREFEIARQDDPKRDSNVFGMAVTAELMGDAKGALDLYRQAASMPSADKEDRAMYLSAEDRLRSQLPRIAHEERAHRDPRRGG